MSSSFVLSVSSVSKFSTGNNFILGPKIGSKEVAVARPPCPSLYSAPPMTDTTFCPGSNTGKVGFLSR